MQLSLIANARGDFSAGGKTLTFDPPAAALEGDVFVIVIAHDPSETFTVPASWTQVATAAGTEDIAALAWEYDGRGDAITVALVAAAHEWQGELVVYRGGAAAIVVDNEAAANFAAATTIAAPNVICTQATDQLLVVWSAAGSPAIAPPATLIQIDNFETAVNAAQTLVLAGAQAQATDSVAPGSATSGTYATGSVLALALRANVPAIPLLLIDPVPGNIGLLGPDTRPDEVSTIPSSVILCHFAEPGDAACSDTDGNLAALVPDPGGGTTMPVAVQGWTGAGRAFTQAGRTGFITADVAAANGTLLLRDAFVCAVLSITLAGAAGTQTIYCRGLNDGTPDEQVSLGLQITQQAWNPGFVEVALFWRDSSGTLVTAPPGVFQAPPDGEFFMLTATRRWMSQAAVGVRYYVDEQQIADMVFSQGDIAGATVAQTTIGGLKSVGAWSNFFQGTLCDLQVGNYEMCAEEVRAEWRRLYLWQPAGAKMFAGLVPPGAKWAQDPGNRIGRLVKLAGQMHGLSMASAEKLRMVGTPDAGTIEIIQRWEAMDTLVAAPRDTLDTRRARVLAQEAMPGGFALTTMQAALAGVMGVPDSEVVIVANTNTITDDFTEATLDPQLWAIGPVGTWTSGGAGGSVSLAVAGGTDLRYVPSYAWCHLRSPLPGTDGVLALQTELETYWTGGLPRDSMVGAYLYNRRSGNAIWFGVGNVAGTRQVGYRLCVAGTLGAFVSLAASPDAPIWLRVTLKPTDTPGDYTFGWSITGPATGYTFSQVATGITDVEWAGLAAVGNDATILTNLAVTFGAFECRSPHGRNPFCWYAYRDPAASGVLDVVGAKALLAKIKPAFTYAAAIQSYSVLFDDPVNGLCDGGPMGALG